MLTSLLNISAYFPQTNACINELRFKVKGYGVPLHPKEPANDHEREGKSRFVKVLDIIEDSIAMNLVIRQGNSDRHSDLGGYYMFDCDKRNVP